MGQTAILPHVHDTTVPDHRYFSANGCVVHRGEERNIFVGGTLVGSFHVDDRAMRNVLIVTLTQDRRVRIGKLAQALGISAERIRVVRRRYEEGGLTAITELRTGGRGPACSDKDISRLERLFEQGAKIDDAHAALGRRVSRSLVGRIRKEWADARKAEAARTEAAEPAQIELSVTPVSNVEAKPLQWVSTELPSVASGDSEKAARKSDELLEAPAIFGGNDVEAKSSHPVLSTESSSMAGDDGEAENASGEIPLEAAVEYGGQRAQYVGTWLMLAMVGVFGLYRLAEHFRHAAAEQAQKDGKRFVTAAALRIALDAAAIALTLGEGCVEGVRRIATPSAATLLRSRRTVSETWTRRVLHGFADTSGEPLHLTQMQALARIGAAGSEERYVCYVDNHMRTYTGKFTVRKGWRMQDKRARPGVSDCYVHDVDGNPLFRLDDPTHQSLTSWLMPVGTMLRDALGKDGPVPLLVFDRGGAFPKAMSELRDANFEFATYERAPYQTLAASAFDKELELGDEKLRFTESHKKNLRRGRGRVRRIAVRMPDGKQVNILAVSQAPADAIIGWMLARWCQENQFKHASTRWGSNHIDSYSVDAYDPDAIIPNPARRRLERSLNIARASEGQALRKLKRLPRDHKHSQRLEQDAADARHLQEKLEALRPETPNRAPVRDTPLADSLKRHPRDYKMLVDTLRIVLANAESELATRLAPHLARPDQAKKTLANLLAAPGHVRLGKRHVVVSLEPVGTVPERKAFEQLLGQVNDLQLTLPGDHSGRSLRFKLHVE
jgi:hypothetical protein|tara:strand:+ start:226 stop:2574 length:2349 start_codon:yes stop_codon:yes gene_type:complete